MNCRTFASPWGNEDTEHLIEILAKYNVKTTFFVVGDWVDKYPESVKALHDAGHEVMSHSTHHDHYYSLTSSQIVADIQESCDKIEAVTGCSPTLIRCPYGEYDDHVISAVRSLGMEPIQWDVDSLDWKDYDAATIIRRVTEHKHLGNGSIILCHNGGKHTAEALDELLTILKKKGFQLVPISALIMKDNYTINTEGRQIKN